MKHLICDTTFYYGPSKNIIEDSDIRIIGTAWNAWEIATASQFNDRKFRYLQNAAKRYLEIPVNYIQQSPIEYCMGGMYSSRTKRKSNKAYQNLITILRSIVEAPDFNSYSDTEAFENFRSYDNRARRDMEGFLDKCIRKHKEHSSSFDPNLMYGIFLVNFREFVHNWYHKHFGIIIYRGNVDLPVSSVFVQVLLSYFSEIFTGARSIGNNDFNDLMHILYLSDRNYFNTSEKTWIRYLDNLDVFQERLIKSS